MLIKQLIDEDFTNYKKASMFIGFPTCTFKCEKDANCGGMCQNSELYKSKDIDISIEDIVKRYLSNTITSAIVCGGLEPFDSFDDLLYLIKYIRNDNNCNDDIVIYTGYYDYEIKSKLIKLQKFSNIIIKYGRYVPNKNSKYDELLGVILASDNQYAELLRFDKYKIAAIPSKNQILVNKITEKLKSNGGFCPCRLQHNEDTLCPCKEFRENMNNGIETDCHCGLFHSTIF